MEHSIKQFLLKHDFEDVMSIEDLKEISFGEEHFNIKWELSLSRKGEFFSLTLKGPLSFGQAAREIEAEVLMKIISKNGKSLSVEMNYQFGNPFNMFRPCKEEDFITRKKLDEDYNVDKKVTIEAHVTIKKMIGFGKEDLRKFDQSIEEMSDIAIVVKDRKFYLLKMFLALQSSYFKSLLLGNFEESQKSEIVLNDIDPDDFQNFLELIHGEDSIDNSTIDGILHLADMYDAPTAIKRCEKFLLQRSDEKLKKKLEMSIRYNLNELKEKCLSEIQSVEEIRYVMPDNINDMDSSLAKALLQKSLALH